MEYCLTIMAKNHLWMVQQTDERRGGQTIGRKHGKAHKYRTRADAGTKRDRERQSDMDTKSNTH